jgi:pyruvate kinase
MPPETLPGIQKRLIAGTNRAGKPVITATQMLDSMIRNPRPTRAEATDVANAVLDGSDGVMLSGETAAGKYPLEAVRTMARIALEAERLFDYEGWAERIAALADPIPEPEPEEGGPPNMLQVTEAVCEAADHIAEELGAKAIIALTRSGTTARFVAKYRPRSTLVAVTDRPATRRALAVTWGVQALLLERFGETIETLNEAERLARDAEFVTMGDLLVFIGGLPEPQPGQTSLLKVQIAD